MFISRRHGNTNREPSVAFNPELTSKIVNFIQNYTEANDILLPGQIPEYKKYDMKPLPLSTSTIRPEPVTTNDDQAFQLMLMRLKRDRDDNMDVGVSSFSLELTVTCHFPLLDCYYCGHSKGCGRSTSPTSLKVNLLIVHASICTPG